MAEMRTMIETAILKVNRKSSKIKKQFRVLQKSNEIVIELHVDRWLNSIPMDQSASVMIPGKAAVQLLDELVKYFEIGHVK